jgi:hypothetical protein
MTKPARAAVVFFDGLGHQSELVGRLRCTWRCDCRISATRLGRDRALRASSLHLRVAHRAG